MRADSINAVLFPLNSKVLDTNIPFFKSNRIWRSLAFRFKNGLLIRRINTFITENLEDNYDLIWVDKAIFISPKTTLELRNKTKWLIHYTPDTAFFQNKSTKFFKSLPYYDFVLTTKSFDLPKYGEFTADQKLICLNQGFHKSLHFSQLDFEEKRDYVLFIGLYESSRAVIVQELLKNGIKVCLAGMNWRSFVRNNKYEGLTFLGDSIIEKKYAVEISKAKFALGLVSKRFPELHTTRTFEIPACGTALITERNSETSLFFNEDEAIFFDNLTELVSKIRFYLLNTKKIKNLTEKGTKKVLESGYDYNSQFGKLFAKLGIE